MTLEEKIFIERERGKKGSLLVFLKQCTLKKESELYTNSKMSLNVKQ